MGTTTHLRVDRLDFGHVGWKYYNHIREKAMEREFSWSGLWLSLSIAFFIVLATAQGLSLIYDSLEKVDSNRNIFNTNLYKLERVDSGENFFLNSNAQANLINKILSIQTVSAAKQEEENTTQLAKCSNELKIKVTNKYTGKTIY